MKFNGTPDSENPLGSLIRDASGTLYGTTELGGSSNFGTVFKVAAGSATSQILASFNAPPGGTLPVGSLIADSAGNLYGTTQSGGAHSAGTIFKVTAGTNTITTLASFTGQGNGLYPQGNLIADASGNLYTTAADGGSGNDGTVVELVAGTSTLTTLATFSGMTNGAQPFGGLIADAAGNLYGTTQAGGSNNDGTVFKMDVGTGKLSTLYSFSGTDGQDPLAGLFADSAGNLYSTTYTGGSSNDGTVFELSGTDFVVLEPSSMTLVAISCFTLLRRCHRVSATTRAPHFRGY